MTRQSKRELEQTIEDLAHRMSDGAGAKTLAGAIAIVQAEDQCGERVESVIEARRILAQCI